MIPENRTPTHRGVILKREVLEHLGITQVALAAHLGIPVQRVDELVRGKRGVTPGTAWLLSQALDTTPELRVHLRSACDLARSRPAAAVGPLVSVAWRHRRREPDRLTTSDPQ